MPLQSMTGQLGLKNAKHLLRRATFGWTIAQVKDFSTKTFNEAVNELFADKALPTDEPTLDDGTTWVGTYLGDTLKGPDKSGENWFFEKMFENGVTPNIREKITWMFHTHIPSGTQSGKGNGRYYYQMLLRHFAYSDDINIKRLNQKICIDNEVVRFLDSDSNRKGRVQENFARECIELYIVGKGRNIVQTEEDDYGVFTERDVEEAARLFTGWDENLLNNEGDTYTHIDPETGLPQALIRDKPWNNHDNDPKTFSKYFGNRTITPDPTLFDEEGRPTRESMLKEIEEFIDMCYENIESSRNICRRIYRFFCNYKITDEVDANIIGEMVKTLQNNNYNLKPVIEELLKSTHFYSADNNDKSDDHFGALIKSPLELMIGTLNLFGFNNESQFEDYWSAINDLHQKYCEAMGMRIHMLTDVAGYPAYFQEPDFNRFWINATYLVDRYDFISDFLGGNQFFFKTLKLDIIGFFETNISDPSDVNVLVDELILYVLPQEVSKDRRDYFKYVLNQDFSDVNWATEWAEKNDNEEVERRLKDLLNAVMQSPEYQLF